MIASYGFRRSELETDCDILLAIDQGSTKLTHVMYSANLGWTVMRKKLDKLEQLGFVEERFCPDGMSKKKLFLTEKGLLILAEYLDLRRGLGID
jgi:predicted transcriptional regulator